MRWTRRQPINSNEFIIDINRLFNNGTVITVTANQPPPLRTGDDPSEDSPCVFAIQFNHIITELPHTDAYFSLLPIMFLYEN